MSPRDRTRTPIIDAVRRQRAIDDAGRDPYNSWPRAAERRLDPWAAVTDTQRAEAGRMLAGRDPLTLE